MILALLIGLAGCVYSGWRAHSLNDPMPQETPVAIATAKNAIEANIDSVGQSGWDWENIHEVLANLTLLVLVHLLGVALVRWLHRENPAKSMITGKKRLD